MSLTIHKVTRHDIPGRKWMSALSLFRLGYDTIEIAQIWRSSEHHVYNCLTREREWEREERRSLEIVK